MEVDRCHRAAHSQSRRVTTSPSISLYFLVLIRVGDLDGDGNYKSYWIFTGYSRDVRGTEED